MKRAFAFLNLLLFFAKEVVLSNLQVARDVLGRTGRLRPGIVTIRISDLTERQAFVLANLITMTPGTLSLDLSIEERTLTLHTLYSDQTEKLQQTISAEYEPKIIHAL